MLRELENQRIETAWAAGLFEGEGTLVTRNQRGTSQANIQCTDEDVIRKYARIVGVGRVYGPYLRKNRIQNKPYWQWSVGHKEDLIKLYKMFKPFLGVRRSQKFDLVIKELEGVRTVAHQIKS